MLTAQDLSGVMGMMPAFTTPDGASMRATSTVDVGKLKAGVDRIIKDGLDVIATTGSYGEFYNLLWEEFETITRATVEAVNKRVPLFVGCCSLNPREVIRKMEVARDAGADGALVAVPFYFPSTVDNAVQFYHEIADLFPELAIMIYHNPPLHKIHIPVDGVKRILEKRNVVAIKDTHRDPVAWVRLMQASQGRLAVFVHQSQYYPYAKLGAKAFWSIDAWMGPWPLLALRDAVKQGDDETARQIHLALAPAEGAVDLSWRETARKVSCKIAGYCDPGPLRAPFTHVPPPVMERCRKNAEQWLGLCEKYRPAARTGARPSDARNRA